MTAVQGRLDVSNFSLRSSKRIREIHRELIVSVLFERRNPTRKIARAVRNRRRIGKHRHFLFGRTHRQDTQITVSEVAVIFPAPGSQTISGQLEQSVVHDCTLQSTCPTPLYVGTLG